MAAMLRKGSSGADVEELQRFLVNEGYDLGDYGDMGNGVDGQFGSLTLKAVKEFQEAQNLAVDGVVGPDTWGAITEVEDTPETPEPDERFPVLPERPAQTEEIGDQVVPRDMWLQRVVSPSSAPIYYLVGQVFGVELAYQIGDITEVTRLFGSTEGFAIRSDMTQRQFNGSDVLTVGTVDEILGSTESLHTTFERELRAVGMESPPAWMREDSKALVTFVTAVGEGWSTERTWQALSKLESFQMRFPGLSVVQGQLGLSSFAEPIQEYLSRESDIRSTLLQFRGPNTNVSVDYVSRLIGSGWQTYEVYELAELEAEVAGNVDALVNINDILAYNGLEPLTPDAFVDYLSDTKMAGTEGFTPSAVFEAVNDALRQTALQSHGLNISTSVAESLGTGYSFDIESPDVFDDEAQYVAGVVTANRHRLDLGAYDLDQDQVVKFFLGDSDDPEVGSKLERLGRERGIAAGGFAASTGYSDAMGRLRTQGFTGV